MKTIKLFYEDAYMYNFSANVISCEKNGEAFEIVLDRTAFFPEGGGQTSDTGHIGDARVTDVREENGVIIHFAQSPVREGIRVDCAIDSQERFRKMQNHSGEHIVSATVHRLFGYDNVGFHLGSEDVTVDFNGILTGGDIKNIETQANLVVAKNVGITAEFPDEKTLKGMTYRSKLELTENVRIVTIEDCDVCACCAPHVRRTGEIGQIKLLDFEKYKGGVRCHMKCGFDALDDYNEKYENIKAISAMLSAKQHETAAAVERMLGELEKLKRELAESGREISRLIISSLKPTEGNICVFSEKISTDDMRETVNRAMTLCGGICGVFSGNDEKGYSYIIGSKNINVREKSKEINAALSGRGGGSPTMIQGSSAADRNTIEKYFSTP